MKMYFVKPDETPTREAPLRRREIAAIPPVTFQGDLDATDSGMWTPPRTILLTGGSVVCSFPGYIPAILILYRVDVKMQKRAMASTSLSAWSEANKENHFKNSFTFQAETSIDPPILGPTESFFVRSMTGSGHQNVVVQLHGEYL